MSKIKLSKEFIRNSVKLALNEDLFPFGDITSSLIENDKIISVKLISNQKGILGGMMFVRHSFALIDDKIKLNIKKKDGSKTTSISMIWGFYTLYFDNLTKESILNDYRNVHHSDKIRNWTKSYFGECEEI